jgi:hypothetical protein
MNDPQGFDTQLAALFEREHRQVAADAFVVATMEKVRARRRFIMFMRTGLRAAGLVAVVAASPWLIAGVGLLNDAVGSSLASVKGMHGAWLLGALAVVWVVATHLRGRR